MGTILPFKRPEVPSKPTAAPIPSCPFCGSTWPPRRNEVLSLSSGQMRPCIAPFHNPREVL